MPSPATARTSLSDLARLFLRLGFTAFGGPAAHIAIMENEVVRRRRWLSSERFLDLFGASNLIPGRSSTELAIFIGYEQAGWLGLLVGGVCFILPAALMVTVLAWLSGALVATVGIFLPGFVLVALVRPLLARLRRSPTASAFLDGVNVAALALMAVVTVQLAGAALVDPPTVLLAVVGAVVLIRFKVSTTWLIAGGAALGAVIKSVG